ncbi:MAG: gliding motility protein GldC [Armatimonadota bacterium]
MPETHEIRLEVALNEKRVPTSIRWEASEGDSGTCRAFLLSLWDADGRSALRIDLWTPEMTVDEMKAFCWQTLAMMAETMRKATLEEPLASEISAFAERFRELIGIPQG